MEGPHWPECSFVFLTACRHTVHLGNVRVTMVSQLTYVKYVSVSLTGHVMANNKLTHNFSGEGQKRNWKWDRMTEDNGLGFPGEGFVGLFYWLCLLVLWCSVQRPPLCLFEMGCTLTTPSWDQLWRKLYAIFPIDFFYYNYCNAWKKLLYCCLCVCKNRVLFFYFFSIKTNDDKCHCHCVKCSNKSRES